MSDSYEYDLVCIGSGPAGQRAAVQAAKLGHRAAVVEKRRAVGGVCIDTGTIPSKTFREAVVAFAGPRARATGCRGQADARPTCQQLLRLDVVIAREIGCREPAPPQRRDAPRPARPRSSIPTR